MSNAIAARVQGDDYQVRFFWIQACRMFFEHTKITKVTYEVNHAKGFDDIGVFYSSPIADERGDLITADLYQIKYHVTQSGVILCDSLIDPSFINATSDSFLQNLHQAQSKLATDATGYRFFFGNYMAIRSNR